MEKKFKDECLKSSISEDRIEALERLGFEWAKRKGDHSWNTKYKELCEYFENYGHADVPTKFDDNKALGRWISTQRSQYKQWKNKERTQMTAERYRKLCLIGFKWDMLLNALREEDVENDEE
jgi:hypothetical protein